MRTSNKAELAFKTQLVQNTKNLVADQSVGLNDKLAVIQQAVSENSSKLARLREARSVAKDPAKIAQIEHLITLRQRVTRYLVATSKLLVRRDDRLRAVQVHAPLSSVAASSAHVRPPN